MMQIVVICFCAFRVRAVRLPSQDKVARWALRVFKAVPDTCVQDVIDGENTCKFISMPTNKACRWNTSYKADNLRGGYQSCLSFKVTCAVVGSSGHLLESFRGNDIDSHDVVIRMNGAPDGNGKFANLAKHVGTKTDVRFLNQFALIPPLELNMEKCIFLHEPSVRCGRDCWVQKNCEMDKCDAGKMKCRGHAQSDEKKWGDNHVFLDNVHGDMANILRQTNTIRRTAGLIGISYALRTCDHVSIYGFGPDCAGHVGARYYNNSVSVSFIHGYDAELHLLKKLAFEGIDVPPQIKSSIHAQTFALKVPKCWKGKEFWESPKRDREVNFLDVQQRLLLRTRVDYYDSIIAKSIGFDGHLPHM